MKRSLKMLALTAAVLFAVNGLFADDFDFGDSDDFSFDSDSSSSGASSGSSFLGLDIGGSIKLDMRAYVDSPLSEDDERLGWGWNSKTLIRPDANLSIEKETDYVKLDVDLNLSKKSVQYYPEDIITNASAQLFLGDFVLEAGKKKIVWGKGDKLHVLDNFLADDYTDFIIPDFLDRRLAEPMVGLSYNAPSGSWALEAIYTPMMTQNRYASSGVWVPGKVQQLKQLVTNVEMTKLGVATSAKDEAQTALAVEVSTGKSAEVQAALKEKLTEAETNYLLAMREANSISADDLYEDTNTLAYSQAGLRLTATSGTVDWGLSYYYGHKRDVSVNMEQYLASAKANAAAGLGSTALPELSYDRVHIFGVEAATVLFKYFNSRAEFAYNLTEDVAGDDPWVHNNSIAWLAGFDVNLPIHNVNVNIQDQGSFILNGDKIKDNDKIYSNFDVDHDANDVFTKNHLVLNVSDTFLREKLKTEVTLLWGIERGDIVLQPKVSWTVKPDFTVSASGLWIWANNEDSEFYSWRHNSFAQLGMQYLF